MIEEVNSTDEGVNRSADTPAHKRHRTKGKSNVCCMSSAGVQAGATPRLSCDIVPLQKGLAFSFQCLPDMGSTKTLMSLDAAQQHGMEIIAGSGHTLHDANNASMKVEGTRVPHNSLNRHGLKLFGLNLSRLN